MRSTSSAAWTAALAVMSMQGPFTTAEAAPARHHDQERPQYYIPKHVRRGGYNNTALGLPGLTSNVLPDPAAETKTDTTTSPPPVVDETTTHTRRTRSTTKSTPSDEELLSSFLAEGLLPMTENTVVTTTMTIAKNQLLFPETDTYTLTYTETSSPATTTTKSTDPPVIPLITSQSIPLDTSPAPIPVPEEASTTSTHRRQGSHRTTSPVSSSSSAGLLGLPHLGGTGNLLPTPIASSSVNSPSSAQATVPPGADSSAPLLGTGGLPLTSILPLGKTHTRHHQSPEPSSGLPLLGTNILPLPAQHTETKNHHSKDSSDGLLGTGLLGTNGILPTDEPTPTRHGHGTKLHTPSGDSTTSDGHLIVGLSTAISVIPSLLSPLPIPHITSAIPDVLSSLGLTGLPTGLPTGTSGLPLESLSIPIVNPHHQRPHGRPNALSGLTNALPSLQLPTGVFPPSSDAVPTGATKSTDGILPPLGLPSALSGLTSALGGITGGLTSVVPDVTSALGGLTSVVPDVTSAVGSMLPTDVPPVVNPLGTSGGLPLTGPGSLTITAGGTSIVVPVPGISGVTSVAVTGTDGSTALPTPVPTGGSTTAVDTGLTGSTAAVSTGGSTTAVDTTTGSTAAETGASNTISSTPGYGTGTSTSIGLNSGTTVSLGSTGVMPSSYVSPTPPSSSGSAATQTTAEASTVSSQTTAAVETTNAPQTIRPTGTDTYTTLALPTSWTFAPTTGTKTGDLTIAPSGSNPAPSGIPTYMPQYVQPPGGMPSAPSNATLIQVGFDFGLNYPFVVSQPESARQIFAYLPQGIAYGLGISHEDVMMNGLLPYDTSASLNYITTLATAYIPQQLVGQLEMSLHMPLSDCYSNPNTPVRALMKMINPTIPIQPGSPAVGSSSLAWNPAAEATSTSGDGAPIGGDSGSSNKVRGTSVGIGVGAVCGAAVYAAAMVYVARRYRKKRAGHQRASSVPSYRAMSQRSAGMGGFFMSGANGRGSGSGSGARGSRTSAGSSNGRSVREQGISAPIMAENSLGWT